MTDERPSSCVREGPASPEDFDRWPEGGWLHARGSRIGGKHLADGRPVGDVPMEDSRPPDEDQH